MISQRLRSKESIIDVRPSKAATKVVMNRLGQTKEQNVDTGQTIDKDTSDQKANRTDKGAAENIPQNGGLDIIYLLDCGATTSHS
jgi:hypothetical protein